MRHCPNENYVWLTGGQGFRYEATAILMQPAKRQARWQIPSMWQLSNKAPGKTKRLTGGVRAIYK